MDHKRVVMQFTEQILSFIWANFNFSISWRIISLFLIVNLFYFCFSAGKLPKLSISFMEFILFGIVLKFYIGCTLSETFIFFIYIFALKGFKIFFGFLATVAMQGSPIFFISSNKTPLNFKSGRSPSGLQMKMKNMHMWCVARFSSICTI